jgi:hypothetical protein
LPDKVKTFAKVIGRCRLLSAPDFIFKWNGETVTLYLNETMKRLIDIFRVLPKRLKKPLKTTGTEAQLWMNFDADNREKSAPKKLDKRTLNFFRDFLNIKLEHFWKYTFSGIGLEANISQCLPVAITGESFSKVQKVEK